MDFQTILIFENNGTIMHKLTAQHCEACRADAPLLSPAKLEEMMTDIPQWTRKVHHDIEKLIREFEFNDFKQALEFTNRVAALAEQENHHPTLVTEWGKVTVYWWTHTINGLHLNDFIMAAKTDLASSVE